MHVYTLVKPNWIGFLIVGSAPLDYSIDSRIKRARLPLIELALDFRSAHAPDRN